MYFAEAFPPCFLQELVDPLILIYDKKISSVTAVVKVLELALKVKDLFCSFDFIF